MENQQTTETASQNQPPSNTVNGNNGNGVGKSRDARITKIKQKFLPGFRITLLLSLAIYLAMLIVGALAVHKCPVEENIPLFLIATGAIGLISKMMTYTRERILRHFQVKYVESSLYTVETVFLVLGAFWVYKEYPANYDPAVGEYCQKSAYLFAFIYITIVLVVMCSGLIAMFVCLLCCLCCVTTLSTCMECDVENQDDENESEDDEEDGNAKKEEGEEELKKEDKDKIKEGGSKA